MIVPFEPIHAMQIEVQKAQLPELPEFREMAPSLSSYGPAWTIIHGEIIVCCAGIIRIHEHRASFWGMFAGRMGPRAFLHVDRSLRRLVFKENPVRRLETTVPCGFTEGHRWAQSCGFVHEGDMRSFLPDGSDVHLYARVA